MLADRNTIVLLLPEIILVAMAAWIYVGGTITRSRAWWLLFSLATYLAAGLIVWRSEGPVGEIFEAGSLVGPLILDPLGQGIRWLALLVGVLFTLIAGKTAAKEMASEVNATLMLVVAGLMLVSRANNLVLLFLSLELISIPTYVLLYLGRTDRASAESTVKYFFLSLLASAMLLYGLSFLYGMAGVTLIAGGQGEQQQVTGIREALASLAATPRAAEQNILLLLGLVFTFGGLAFKVAAVPFQFYAPDVYEGTTNVNAGLLATVPKIAGMVALVRLLVVAIPDTMEYAWQVVLVVAVLTMTVGNVSALWQNNVRRLLAYSSVAHAGYMLIGLAVALAFASIQSGTAASEAVPPDAGPLSAIGQQAGVGALLLYLVVYVLAAIGTFAALSYLSNPGNELNDVDQLAGLGRSRPAIAFALAVFMFSLAGIPPLSGFWGKLGLFTGAIQLATDTQSPVWGWFLALAVVGVVNAAIAAAYYLRIVGVMFFRPAGRMEPTGEGNGPLGAVALCVLLLVFAGAMPAALMQQAEQAGQGLVVRPPAAGITAAGTTAAGNGGRVLEVGGAGDATLVRSN